MKDIAGSAALVSRVLRVAAVLIGAAVVWVYTKALRGGYWPPSHPWSGIAVSLLAIWLFVSSFSVKRSNLFGLWFALVAVVSAVFWVVSAEINHSDHMSERKSGPSAEMGKDVSDLWREMSARVQNLHHRILVFGPSAGLDYSAFEVDLKGVDEALDELVAAGELESKTMQLRSAGELGEEKFESLSAIVEDVASRYGFFVATEMCDLGARMRFMTVESDQTLRLHLRLPKGELDRVVERIAELGLAEPSGSE